jgi:hypothetical protein
LLLRPRLARSWTQRSPEDRAPLTLRHDQQRDQVPRRGWFSNQSGRSTPRQKFSQNSRSEASDEVLRDWLGYDDGQLNALRDGGSLA